eukprot:scaffold165090_cov13-Tisochrysis_lutea.AAC.1
MALRLIVCASKEACGDGMHLGDTQRKGTKRAPVKRKKRPRAWRKGSLTSELGLKGLIKTLA